MNKKDYYYALILDKHAGEDFENPASPELKEAVEYFKEKANKNMGIGMLCAGYIFTKDGEDVWSEYKKIKDILDVYVMKYALAHNKAIEDYSLEFINYGRTQLVYVLTDNTNNSKITLLVKQPSVKFGKIKQEAQNLIELHKKDKNVVAPIDYFAMETQELYVTPYLNQARCIASDENWGMYVPEPVYRFVPFTQEQEKIVNACMIAKLISYYDEKTHEGIAACKLGGGDFMLPKGWEDMSPTYENTLKNLYFIAAREKIKCPLDKYIEIIKSEFSKKTIDKNQNNITLNHRARIPMTIEDINKGIEFGKRLLKSKQNEK